ncbi:imelysin family protein [Marinobacterium sp. xm-a-152]|jgi:putative iron-regulated protein|uniref:imelysin family protein n=1 Tax=Marinobacterium sp. xm-a-152 TaxID=2497733 RepID=UPI001568FE9A|nr:imelysin family protein [Marinobacterium sp. xm-a-152]NRP15062.1 Imelysin [Marinobacterium sp. xm-a-152]
MKTLYKPLAFSMLSTCIASSSFAGTQAKNFLNTYADLAGSSYQAALSDAKSLQSALQEFAAAPNAMTLEYAKQAWLQSRETYGVTEIFRLSEGPIDAEEGWVADTYGALEGQLNAWPLDENMIDYTTAADGSVTSGNIVDTAGVFNPGGEDAEAVDVSSITADAISALNENGGDANVATGYHAIEFLLWGQDQDYSNFTADAVTPGALAAGARPLTDFTTDANATRRLEYLNAAADLLVSDLETVNSAWVKCEMKHGCKSDTKGAYRNALLGQHHDSAKNLAAEEAARTIIAGMGVFIKSELANERIAVAVLTPSEEDEHSCFSDNTHRDIALNYQGFVNVLKGELNGEKLGASLYDSASAETQAKLDSLIAAIDTRVNTMNELAESKMHFDYQIVDATQANEIRRMKNDMRKLGDAMVAVAADLSISLTEDDVTDAEETQI